MTHRWSKEALAAAALIVSIVAFTAVVGLFQVVFGQDPEEQLREQQTAILSSLADSPPSSLEFTAEGNTTIIREAAELSEFFRLLVEPSLVPRHHSHPEYEAVFRLHGSATTYVLGRDSQVADEYWLQLDEGNGSAQTIKLFHSEGLTLWLVRNGTIKE